MVEHLLVPGVVGREPELDELSAFLAEVPAGRAGAMVVTGEPGMGKTTLARAAIALAEDHGIHVLRCSGAELETELSYVALGDLLAGALEPVVDRLPGPQRHAIEVALSRCEPDGAPPEPGAVAVAVRGVLLELAASAPLVVVVDDAQWLDASSLRVLAFVARRLADVRIGVLATQRGSGPLALGMDRPPPGGRVRRVEVGPLSPPAIGRLLHLRLGLVVPRPLLHELHSASGGNPLYALELARALGPGQRLVLPGSLRDAVADRLARLSPAAHDVLLAAAALTHPNVATLRRIEPAADEALSAAAAAGVVDVDEDGRVRFAHPLLAHALYGAESAASRRAMHRRLADVVGDDEERPRQLALGTSEPDIGVAQQLEDAARRARWRAAPEAAAWFADAAVRLTPPSLTELLLARRLESGRLQAHSGDAGRACATLDAVVAAAPVGDWRARALHTRATAAWGADNYAHLAGLLERGLSEAQDERLRVSILVDLATALLQAGSLAKAQRCAHEARELAERLGAPGPLSAALTISAMADFLGGERVAPGDVERAARLRGDESDTALPPAFLRALLLKWSDRLQAARDELAALLRDAQERNDEQSLGFILMQLGELECWLGRPEAAQRYAQVARDATVHGGQDEPLAGYVDALARAYLGDAAGACRAARAAVATAEATANNRFLIRCLAVIGFAQLSTGDVRAAADPLRRAMELASEAGYGEPGVLRFHHDAVEALVGVGDIAAAEGLCRELEAHGRRPERPWARAAGARSRALLLTAAGELAAAEDRLVDARRGFEALGQPLELGRTLLLLGAVRRRRRQKRLAREALDAAAEVFAALPAPLWEQKARDERARIGGRPAAPGDLTVTERRVADLAARGFTNREIAEMLFMSVKTVERHVSHAFDKLGVRSRRALGPRLVDQPLTTRGTVPDSSGEGPD